MSAVSVSLCFVTLLIKSCFAEATKASKSTQTPPTSRMIHWDKLEVVDYLRSGALLVAFFAVLLSDKRGKTGNVRGRKNMFVNAEVVAFFVTGLACYFFPTSFLEYITKTSLSYSHAYVVQVVGAMLVSEAVITARLQSSLENNAVVHTNWLMCRTVGSLSLFMFLSLSHCTLDIFTEQNKTFVLLGVGLWFAGCLWQFFTMEQIGGVAGPADVNSGLNVYIWVEAFLGFAPSIVIMTHPEAVKDLVNLDLDPLNHHMMIAVHILKISLMVLPLFGMMFYSKDSDKKQIYVGRMVFMMMVLPLTVFTNYKHGLHTQKGMVLSAVMTIVYMVMILRAYTLPDDKKSR